MSERKISGLNLGQQLCDVLGLDRNKVAGIEIRAYPGDVARVTVECLVTMSETNALVDGLKRYELVEVTDAEG